MWNMVSRLRGVSALIVLLTMAGCGSGGGDAGVAAPLYSGSTTPAAITQGNADEVARTSTEGVSEAVNMTAAGDALSFLPAAAETRSATDALAQTVGEVVFGVLDGSSVLNLPSAALLTSSDLNGGSSGPFCGGSVSYPDNIDPNATTLDFAMGFNSLCYDDGVTALIMNGSLRFVKTATSVAMTFTNFSVNIDGVQEAFSGTFSCDATMGDCTIATDYVGADGNTYRLANVVIDTINGYSIDATFYHHELGKVTIQTLSPIGYSGCGAYPSSGIITVSSTDGSSITVTFSGCAYSITGVDANAVSISASGSWT